MFSTGGNIVDCAVYGEEDGFLGIGAVEGF
jgi:hypothetical protein